MVATTQEQKQQQQFEQWKDSVLDQLKDLNVTDLFIKNGKIVASNGKKFYEVTVQSKQGSGSKENSVQKILFALGEGQFDQISTEDIRINNQPLSIFNKRPVFQTRIGVKDQRPIENLRINDVERFFNQEVLRDDDPLVILLGNDLRVTNTELTFRWPSGLFALTTQAQKVVYNNFHIRIQIQKKREVSENVFENVGTVDLVDPENDTIPAQNLKISRMEDRQFDYSYSIDFTPYLDEGERGGVFELTITRISPFDNSFQVSRVNLLRLTEYIFVEDDANIAYSDTPLLYMEAEAQSNLQGQIPKVEVRVKGTKTARCREIVIDSYYGQTNLSPSSVPKDILDYQPSDQMTLFLNVIRDNYIDYFHKIGELENIEVKNISTGEFTTIKDVQLDGTITLRSTIFNSASGGERFSIRFKKHSYNMADQFTDLVMNPDYGLGRAFRQQILNFDNLKEIADYYEELVPIDGENYLLEGEIGATNEADLGGDSKLNQTIIKSINHDFNKYLFSIGNLIKTYCYPDGQTRRSSAPTDFDIFYKPRLLTTHEFSINEANIKNGEKDLNLNVRFPSIYQGHYDKSVDVASNQFTNLVLEQENISSTTQTYHTDMILNVPGSMFWSSSKIPTIYEIKLEGSVGGGTWKTIKTYMVGHKHYDLPTVDFTNSLTNTNKPSARMLAHEHLQIEVDLYDFVVNTLGLSPTNGYLESVNFKITVRGIHHLYYYSNSNQFSNRVEEITSLEDQFGDIATPGTDLYINNQFLFSKMTSTVAPDSDDNFGINSELQGFMSSIYDDPHQMFTDLVAFQPGTLKSNYHAISTAGKIHFLTTPGLFSAGVKGGPIFIFHSYDYRQTRTREEEDLRATVVRLNNYDQVDASGTEKTITPVNIDRLVAIKKTEFRTDDFSSIYKQVEEIQVPVRLGDIIYNLDTFERAEIVGYVYWDGSNFTYTPGSNTKLTNYVRLDKNIFNLDGTDGKGNQGRYRIYSRDQCEVRHKSSFVVSQFYEPKQYFSSMLAAANTLINIEGDKISLSIEGLSRLKEEDEVIISEADLVPGSLSIASKAKDSVPNTIEIQFMDEKNRNTKSTITVRDRNALQGLDEEGNLVNKPQPERKAQAFFPQIGRASEAVRKANRDLNFAKFVDHTISFNTHGIGGNMNIGDTFQFRAPITRIGTSGSAVRVTPTNNNLTTFVDGEEMVMNLATPVGDLLDGEIISNQTGNLSPVSGDYDYDRSRVGGGSEGYLDSRDYWCLLFSSEGYCAKFKIERINGFEVVVKKYTDMTQWIEFKHESMNFVEAGYRIIIGIKEAIATRYRLLKKRKIHHDGLVELEAHPYFPKVYSDFAAFAVLDNVGQNVKTEKRSSVDPPKAITTCLLKEKKIVKFEGQTEGVDDVANIPVEFIYQKTFDLKFSFRGPADPFYYQSNVYWKWDYQSEIFVEDDQTDGWKKVEGTPFTESFEIKGLQKTIEDARLQILIQPISFNGVKLGLEQCKKVSLFNFGLKEENEVVDFPKNFTAEFNPSTLTVSLDWEGAQGLDRYMVHTLIKDGGNEYGGDFGWGFPYSKEYKPFGNSKLSSNILDGTHFEYKVAQPGTYQFFIRGLSRSGYLSGELTDFSVSWLSIRYPDGATPDFDTLDYTTLEAKNVLHYTSNNSDDLNLLVSLIEKTSKVKNYAFFTFDTDRNKRGLRIANGNRISGNRFSVPSNLDLSFFRDNSFDLVELRSSIVNAMDFGYEEDYPAVALTDAGPGFIEFASDPFLDSDSENEFKIYGFDLSNNYLTGTVSLTSGNTTIVGSGTDFVTEVQAAGITKIIVKGVEYTVSSVTDANNLVVTVAPTETVSGVRIKKLEEDSEYLVVTNHVENPTDGVSREPARIQNLNIHFDLKRTSAISDLNKLFYQRSSILNNKMVNRVQTLDPEIYDINTIFQADKNILSNIPGYRPGVASSGSWLSVFDQSQRVRYNSGVYRTQSSNGFAYRESAKWKILNPVSVGAGIAEIDGGTEITFPSVENVSMLKIDYDPKTAKIKANWLAQETALLDYYLIKAGFYTTGGSAPDFDDPSLDTFTTKSNEFLFDANAIDADITGDKTFIAYVIGVDRFGTSFPEVQGGFSQGDNYEEFDIVALPEVEFNADGITENVYSDNTGNVVSEIRLNFSLPTGTWEPSGKKLKNVIRHFKIQSREVKTPIALGQVTSVGDSNKITDNLNFGEIADGSTSSEFSHDASNDKFTRKVLVNLSNGEEAFITGTENFNTFILDRNMTQSVGHSFKIIERYELVGVADPDTDIIATDQSTNREFQYKIPILEQGSKFRTLAKWDFKISVVNTFGIENNGVVAQKQLQGKQEIIERPGNAEVREVPGGVVFEVQEPSDADFQKFQFRAIYLPDSIDDVNQSFELKTSQKEDQLFTTDVDRNGSWVFYIFTIDKSGQRSVGFRKLQLDVIDKPIKQRVIKTDLINLNVNGFREYDGTEVGTDGNIYPTPKPITLEFTINSTAGSTLLSINNPDIVKITGSIGASGNVLFDASLLENKPFITEDGQIGFTIDSQEPVFQESGGTTSIRLRMDDNSLVSVGQKIYFEVPHVYGVNYDYGQPSPTLPEVNVQNFSNYDNPNWTFDGEYHLDGEIGWAGGFPPHSSAFFRSDVISIEEEDVVVNAEMIPQFATENSDELEDTADFHIWYRTGGSIEDFNDNNYLNNPFVPFKKFKNTEPVFIQFMAIIGSKSDDTSASIKSFNMLLDREIRIVRLNDGKNNYIDITNAEYGYDFLIPRMREIISYAGLSVINDDTNEVKRPYIDTSIVNNGVILYRVNIKIKDNNGSFTTGRVAGFLEVY